MTLPTPGDLFDCGATPGHNHGDSGQAHACALTQIAAANAILMSIARGQCPVGAPHNGQQSPVCDEADCYREVAAAHFGLIPTFPTGTTPGRHLPSCEECNPFEPCACDGVVK